MVKFGLYSYVITNAQKPLTSLVYGKLRKEPNLWIEYEKQILPVLTI